MWWPRQRLAIVNDAPLSGVAVSVRTLGCKVNRVESDTIAATLVAAGALLVDEDEAEAVVLNTCTVTGEADSKARKAVRRALNAGRSPVVVVTGCLAALDSAGLLALGTRVVVESDKSRVAGRVAEALGAPSLAMGHVTADCRVGERFRTRALLKVEDGCDNFCAYCIVPFARGGPRAVPFEEVVRDARALVAAGTPEIVLTGINIGRYRDDSSGANLAELIGAVASTGIERLRISSIEPPDLTPELLAVLAAAPAVCEHLHVPLQSGSDAVLSAMGRRYTADQFAERIQAAREAIVGLAVTTDVIAGFPRETEDQHRQTLDFVENVGFAQLHVFRYSARKGTPAAELAQHPAARRAARAAQLRAQGDRLRQRYLRGRVGSLAEVLVESIAAGRARGTTRDYVKVDLDANGLRVGRCAPAILDAHGLGLS